MSSIPSPPNPLSTQSASCRLLYSLPSELHVSILTFLRAYDLNAVVQTCHFLHEPELLHKVIQHTATDVYSPELTRGFDQQQPVRHSPDDWYRIQHLRNMELLVVARVLSRPEPARGGFYVSKSWCRLALKWLEVQQEALYVAHTSSSTATRKKKLSKKQQRIRNRRLSDVSPPWPNVNADLVCEHQNLQCVGSTKASRARRKLLDKHAWKVLKKLFPDSNSLEYCHGECVQCILEEQTKRRQEEIQEQEEREERKRPLSCPLVRGIYTRTRGVPMQSLVASSSADFGPDAKPSSYTCPLLPGQYHILPRAWCHSWRRYLKTGEGDMPPAPCASMLLCDGHRLPLIPPHLESFLRGDTPALYTTTTTTTSDESFSSSISSSRPVGMDPDTNTVQALRAAGLSATEVASQQMAMVQLEQQQQHLPQQQAQFSPASLHRHPSDQLDRENSIVVELLTHNEAVALEQHWPRVHSNFSFLVDIDDRGHVSFPTPPCQECDARGSHCRRSDLYVKNRARGWVQKSSSKARASASLEY